MLLPLTPPQQEVFDALANYCDQHDYPPTTRELAEATGRKAISNELQAVRKKGWAEKIEGMHNRSTVPTEEALEAIGKKGQQRLNLN